jgi:hypothetical protein
MAPRRRNQGKGLNTGGVAREKLSDDGDLCVLISTDKPW